MKKIMALLCVIFVICLYGHIFADSSKSEVVLDVTAVMGLNPVKSLYTGPPNIPDPNVILQGGDAIEDATIILSLPFSDSGTTAGYTDDYNEICPYNAPGAPDVVYSYAPSVDTFVTISLCGGSAYDTKLYVYMNEPSYRVGCNDDLCNSPNYSLPLVSQVRHLSLNAGNTYYIVVDGYDGDYGDYTIDVEETTPPIPPVNDNCMNAEPIGDVWLQQFSTTLATPSGLGTCITSPDIWYVYTAACDARVTVALWFSGYDTKLAVYDGNSCDTLPPEIECNDDIWQGNLTSAIAFDADSGNQYLIQIGGYNESMGDGNISIQGCQYPELCQESVPPESSWALWTSDVQYGPPYVCYDNYPYIDHICEVQFWGLDARSTSGGWVDCQEIPMDFEIKFYPDDGNGGPDINNPACTYDVTATRTGTGEYFSRMNSDFGELIEFNATLFPCCDLSEGWISIMGNTYPGSNCVFVWLAHLNGDMNGYQYLPPLMQRFWDFSRCLGEGPDCSYVPGDVNGSDNYDGLDITYGVNYFKDTGPYPMCPLRSCPIPPCHDFYYCGDVNGSCSFNGLDITYGVAYFKGGADPVYCEDCPPSGGAGVDRVINNRRALLK